MSEISVRALGDEDWQVYRDIRLSALSESPEAFAAKVEAEQREDESFWRARMDRSARLVAEQENQPVGVVSLGSLQTEDGDPARVAELFGLWVSPPLRGHGVAWALVQAGVDQAKSGDQTHVAYWVGTDNGRAVAFASSFGFLPTDSRRPMRAQDASDDDDDDNTEMLMVLPLSGDPGALPPSLFG